jgi:hypothetical protein
MQAPHPPDCVKPLEDASNPRIIVNFFEDARPDAYRVAARRIFRSTDVLVSFDVEGVMDLANGRPPRGGIAVLKCREPGTKMIEMVRYLNNCLAVKKAEIGT